MLVPKNNTSISALTVYTYFSCSSLVIVAVSALVSAVCKCRRKYFITVDTSGRSKLLGAGGMIDKSVRKKEEVMNLMSSTVCPLDFYRI